MRLGRMTAFALGFIATGLAFGTQAKAAEESGTFSLLVSATTDYATIDHAGVKITGGGLYGTMSVVRSSGGLFPEGIDFLATCVVYATISKDKSDVMSACTMTDPSGDSLFLRARRLAGGIEEGEGGGGRNDLVGGTGKYAGISGNCPYETKYLPDDRLISRTDCAWQR